MTDQQRDFRWRVVAKSERGDSHLRQRLCNQDCVAHTLGAEGRPPVIVAVADGHGSPRSFRSDQGARIAVDVAIKKCSEFVQGVRNGPPSAIKRLVEQQLPCAIAKAWTEGVDEHLQEHPYSDDEQTRCSGSKKDRYLPYGSTLLGAVISEDYLICVQLGDGEVLFVSDETGEPTWAIPKDPSLIANETASLCQQDSWKAVRVVFRYIGETPPAMLFLSTDGYPNSFRTPDEFRKNVSGILEIVRIEGPDSVENDLPLWLREASQLGSGDDMTVALICRLEPPWLARGEEAQDVSPVIEESSQPAPRDPKESKDAWGDKAAAADSDAEIQMGFTSVHGSDTPPQQIEGEEEER